MEYYSVIKKEWNLTICDSMDGPRDYDVKWNKPVGEKQIPYDLTCMWNLKNNINEQRKEKQTPRDREQTDGYQCECVVVGLGEKFKGIEKYR